MKTMKRILALSLSAVLLLALLCACGGGNDAKEKDVDLAAFYLTLTEKYSVPETPEQTYPDDAVSEDFTAEDLKQARESLRQLGLDAYPGLSDIDTKQCFAYVSMMSFNGAEAVLVQVSSASDVDAVKDILQARIDTQINGGAWYPEAIEGWQNNSRIVSNGTYVMLVVSEDCDAIVSEFNALFE